MCGNMKEGYKFDESVCETEVSVILGEDGGLRDSRQS